MSMLRHRRRAMPEAEMRIVYSVRNSDEVIYAGELGEETTRTYTGRAPEGWTGATGRVGRALLGDDGSGTAYVCGSDGFVEAASELLLDIGFAPGSIRTERFGPSG